MIFVMAFIVGFAGPSIFEWLGFSSRESIAASALVAVVLGLMGAALGVFQTGEQYAN